ncbi:MAG: carbon-nitrogen hydrolase family protein, partial [Limisphaerales bacterium]
MRAFKLSRDSHRLAVAVVFALSITIAAAETFSKFSAKSNNWSTWSPRDELAPKFQVSAKGGRNQDSALEITATDVSDFGAWKRKFTNITAGKNYRFEAWYKAEGLEHEARSVAPRLEWMDASGKQLRPPEYAIAVKEKDGWNQVEITSPAPENAAIAEIQLGFGFVQKGSVVWDDISFGLEPSARDRVVRVATIFHRPRGMKSAQESVEEFCRIGKESVAKNSSARPDIICMPEGITVVGTGKSYYEVGETVPGPTSERLGALAKTLNSYVVAGVYEKEGTVLYNTAILVGRDGKLVGKYRKTHLPREEWEAGITPGDEYPVFETDFGKVGLIICWDVQFPEPSRAMARKGAEVLLLPIWGGNETLAKARAIEN